MFHNVPFRESRGADVHRKKAPGARPGLSKEISMKRHLGIKVP
jgi:hypothetical protein